ncbi:hypothetical protein [Pareuzebyella sediminis]|uniref:hypothetical protein n=1 Tax=Pareuzebyella sediminis TaxID=2607998 RepID=UPI0011EC1118|nr:hypothetical protein [Pareuzebyella sediminis]
MNSKPKKTLFVVTLVLTVFIQNLMAQNNGSNSTQDLLSKAISDEILWTKSEITLNEVSKIYLLDHGVVLDLPEHFTIQGIPIEIIQKNQIESIGNFPLVQIHTLNIGDDKALVRIYLSRKEAGIDNNYNAEFQFTKQNMAWVLTNKL